MKKKNVGEVGFEPTRGRPRRILSPLRLPFRHSPSFQSIISLPNRGSSVNYVIHRVGQNLTQGAEMRTMFAYRKVTLQPHNEPGVLS
jgi:hypothetical protein